MRHVLIVPLALAMCASPALAQQPAVAETSATAAAAPPHPVGEGWLTTGTDFIKSTLTHADTGNGFYVAFHGLPQGSGIAAGPGYRRDLFGGDAVVDVSAAGSWSRGTVAQATFALPHLAGDRIAAGAQVKRQDFARVGFFGVGPESLEADATAYALRNTDVLGFAAFRPTAWLTLGGHLGYSQPVTLGRPHATSDPATLDVFTPAAAPGLSARPSYLHSDAYVDVDTRDHPARPARGGNYRFAVSGFDDRDAGRFSFRRIEGEASQYIPILHENWVIALHGRVDASQTSDGAVVPFYLLPTLGGSRSLRGYDDYRFSDRNALLLNAEYRWRVFGALDGALFYDAGKVAARFADLDLTDLKTSYGLGFRFHSSDHTFFRADIGRSSEGTRLLVGISEVFRTGHGSILIPYNP